MGVSSSLPHHPSLWRASSPLVLASGSLARRNLLISAGIPVGVCLPVVDERAIEAGLARNDADASKIARGLATAKAASIGNSNPGQLVLGADQTLECEGVSFHKPADAAAAAWQLESLSGKMHQLHSACSLFQDGREIFAAVTSARLTMRPLSPVFIQAYLETAGASILASVGAYQLEGLGIHLFSMVEGDHSTILGLPLFPLLSFLRQHGSLAG